MNHTMFASVQTHCKEGLARLVQSQASLEGAEGGLSELAAWCLTSDKIKLTDLAEMTEGGASHPLFLTVLQVLNRRAGLEV